MSINYFPQGKAVKVLLAAVAAILLIFIFVLWSSYGAYKRQQQREQGLVPAPDAAVIK